jgi:hypothetical protein
MNYLNFTKLSFLLLFLMGCAFQVQSQALILDQGQHSTHIGAGVATFDDVRSVYLFSSYSPSNKLTIGLDAFRQTVEDTDDLSVIGLAPHIQYYFVRANDQSPLSVGLGASYARSVVRSDFLKSLDIEISENAFRGSLQAAWHASETKKAKVIPFANVGYTYSQIDSSDGIYDYESSSEGISGLVGCIFSIAAGSNAFNIVPSVLIGEDDFGFGVYFGYSLIK